MILCLLVFAFLIPNIVEGYCYWAHDFSDNSWWWEDGIEWCEYYGSEYAYIESIEEWKLVKGHLDNFMNRSHSQYAVNSSYWPYAGIWLGGSAGYSGYGFRNNTGGTFPWVWTNGSPVNFTDWAPNKPNISVEACIMAYQPDNWKWHSLDCHGDVFGSRRKLPILCKQPVRCGAGWIESNKTITIINGTVRDGTQFDKTEGTCYKLLTDIMVNWENAQRECEKLGMNITLAVIQDSDANYLSELLVDNHVSNGRDGFWIGPKDNNDCYYMEEDMQTGNNNTPNHYTKKKAPNCNQGNHHPICEKKWSRAELWQ